MTISIIIPVYNTEKYLVQCINSVIGQSLQDFELILVDDGSADSSGQICDEFASRDSRIKVIHKSNGGAMSAWKTGVKIAQGEYIGSVDSDDWIEPDMYEKLLGTALTYNADLVCCGLTKEYPNGSKEFEKVYFPEKLYDKNEIRKEIFPVMLYNYNTHTRGISPNRYTKIYRKTVLLSILEHCSDTVTIGEDLLATFLFMMKANSIVFMADFHPYHYRIHSESVIQRYSDNKYDQIRELKYRLDIANSLSDYDFKEQINNDHVQLMLEQLDCEMLFSGKKTSELIKSMKKFYNNSVFQEALRCCNKNVLSNKNKLYLRLMKFKMYGLLLLIRKLRKCKKELR